MTSGLIRIVVTGVIGLAAAEPTTAQICRTITIGALSATMLIPDCQQDPVTIPIDARYPAIRQSADGAGTAGGICAAYTV